MTCAILLKFLMKPLQSIDCALSIQELKLLDASKYILIAIFVRQLVFFVADTALHSGVSEIIKTAIHRILLTSAQS